MKKNYCGKIIKGIAGFYYVHVEDVGVFQCKARGVFRNKKMKPLIGDDVQIEVTHEEDMEGNVLEILPRKNELVRPTVSNIDQAIIVFAIKEPNPNLNLLDRFLLVIESKNIESIVCFSKIDLSTKEEQNYYKKIYESAGYKVKLVSAKNIDLHDVEDELVNKTTVFAEPSGVGKSSMINLLQSEIVMETGAVSNKIKRGKHTTRHANLIPLDEHSYVVDTPGFSSLDIEQFEENDVKKYFVEFEEYSDGCKFATCNHINEPNCAVKDAIENGKISESRYKSYLQIYNEIKNIRRW